MSTVPAKVLVVEDEWITAEDLQQTLSHLGYDVPGIARSGEEALAQAEQFRPDLVLMDIRLSGAMDGIGAARELRRRSGVPVVFLTAHSDEATLARAKEVEPHGFLVKPFSEAELRSAVEIALHKSRAEQIVLASERRFRALTEHSTDLVSLLDAAGTIRFESDSVERVLGYSKEERLGKSAFDLIYPEDMPEALAAFERVLAEPGQPHRVDLRARHKEGSWRWLEAIGVNQLSDPAVQAIVVTSRDVTERKEAEERFRELAENVREVFWMFTPGFSSTLYVNPAYTSVFGLPREGLYENPTAFLEVVHPEDLQALLDGMGKIMEAPQSVVFRINRPDGESRILHARGSPVRNAQGEIYRITGLTEDVTEQQLAEEALRRREAQLRQAERLADLGSWEWDIRENRMIWSDNLYRIHGLRPEEVVPSFEGYLERVHPEDRAGTVAAVQQALEAKQTSAAEVRIIRPDGRVRIIQQRRHLIVDKAGRPVRMIGTSQDITERKRMEDALRAAKEEAEAANRAKSEMLSRTSHELRTPLNAILGFGQMLEMDVEREEDRDSVEQILNAGRHLLSLIDQVLDIARAESGEVALPCEPVHVGELIEDALSLLRPLASQNGVELPQSPLDLGCAVVLADRQRLTQVLLSLITNGIKYNREGGRIEVTCERVREARLRIRVRDTGHGIPVEKLSRLFRPFDRLDLEKGSGTGEGGTGLGLALSKALTETMGGTIGAESTPGVGSTFWIELPSPPEEPTYGSAAGRAGDLDRGVALVAPVVLCVDDEAGNVQLIKQVLRRSRPEVELITAQDGREGLQLARERRPDLILLDIHLPGISGEEVLASLQEEASTREIPVVMLSAAYEPEQVRRLRNLGATDYVAKPFEVTDFLRVVNGILDQMPR